MDIFFDRYADVILKAALKLASGDVLSINTEEDNSRFAHIIAEKAKEITGNGSYIQLLEKGKVVDVEEASTDYPIAKKPTALLYLPVIKEYPELEVDVDRVLSAAKLQDFKLLAEPLFNPLPSLPFASAPTPNEAWAKQLDEDGDKSLSASLISDLLSLGEDDYIPSILDSYKILEYECDKFNSLDLVSARAYSEDGTDLTFSFMKGTSFSSSILKTTSGRSFNPTIYSSDIFRALDKDSVSGYLNITKPITLFGKKIDNLSITFDKGSVVDVSATDENLELFKLYLEQDMNASKASMLNIADDTNPASFIDYFGIPEWDRMRATSIVLGSPRPEGIDESVKDYTVDSLVSLYLPIGSDSLSIEAVDKDGEEYMLVEDGIIREEE